MSNIINCLKKNKYEEAFSIILKNIISRKLLRFNDIRIFRLDDFSKVRSPKAKIEIVYATYIHLDKFLAYGLTENTVKDRFNRNDFCRLALIGDEVVGMLWFSLRKDFLQELQYSHLKSNDAVWFYGAYIDPKFRMQGIYMHLISDAKLMAEQNGFTALEAHVDFDNTISIKSHQRLGFRVIKRIVAFQLPWFSIEFNKAPESHVGINFLRNKKGRNG